MRKRFSIIIVLIMNVLVTGCNVHADEESKEQAVGSSAVETMEEVSAIDNDRIPIATEDYTFSVPSTWKGEYEITTEYVSRDENEYYDYDSGEGYIINLFESRDYKMDSREYMGYLGSIEMISPMSAYKQYSKEYEYYRNGRQYLGTLQTNHGIFHIQMYVSVDQDCSDENYDRYCQMIEELKTSIMDSISANEGNTLERKKNPWENTELAYEGNHGQLYVPASWTDKYVVEMNYLDYTDNYGYTLDVYEKMDYEEGNGGYLFGLGFFEKEEDYNNGRYGEITYLGMMKMEADWIDSKQNVILILPSDHEQYSEQNKETYLQMQEEIPLVVSLFKCLDYCSWMSDYEIESDNIPVVNAYSNYLGNSFSGGGVLSSDLPQLYGLVEQDGVDYYWDTSDTQGLRRIGLRNGSIVAYADWIESSSMYYSVTVGSRLSLDVEWGEPKTVIDSGYKYFMWQLQNGYLIICAYDTSENFSQCEAIAEIHVTDKNLCSLLSMD